MRENKHFNCNVDREAIENHPRSTWILKERERDYVERMFLSFRVLRREREKEKKKQGQFEGDCHHPLHYYTRQILATGEGYKSVEKITHPRM